MLSATSGGTAPTRANPVISRASIRTRLVGGGGVGECFIEVNVDKISDLQSASLILLEHLRKFLLDFVANELVCI